MNDESLSRTNVEMDDDGADHHHMEEDWLRMGNQICFGSLSYKIFILIL